MLYNIFSGASNTPTIFFCTSHTTHTYYTTYNTTASALLPPFFGKKSSISRLSHTTHRDLRLPGAYNLPTLFTHPTPAETGTGHTLLILESTPQTLPFKGRCPKDGRVFFSVRPDTHPPPSSHFREAATDAWPARTPSPARPRSYACRGPPTWRSTTACSPSCCLAHGPS